MAPMCFIAFFSSKSKAAETDCNCFDATSHSSGDKGESTSQMARVVEPEEFDFGRWIPFFQHWAISMYFCMVSLFPSSDILYPVSLLLPLISANVVCLQPYTLCHCHRPPLWIVPFGHLLALALQTGGIFHKTGAKAEFWFPSCVSSLGSRSAWFRRSACHVGVEQQSACSRSIEDSIDDGRLTFPLPNFHLAHTLPFLLHKGWQLSIGQHNLELGILCTVTFCPGHHLRPELDPPRSRHAPLRVLLPLCLQLCLHPWQCLLSKR